MLPAGEVQTAEAEAYARNAARSDAAADGLTITRTERYSLAGVASGANDAEASGGDGQLTQVTGQRVFRIVTQNAESGPAARLRIDLG